MVYSEVTGSVGFMDWVRYKIRGGEAGVTPTCVKSDPSSGAVAYWNLQWFLDSSLPSTC